MIIILGGGEERSLIFFVFFHEPIVLAKCWFEKPKLPANSVDCQKKCIH